MKFPLTRVRGMPYNPSVMSKEQILQQRVKARKDRLDAALAQASRIATARVARGNACLQLGKFADEKDLQERRARFSKAVMAMA